MGGWGHLCLAAALLWRERPLAPAADDCRSAPTGRASRSQACTVPPDISSLKARSPTGR